MGVIIKQAKYSGTRKSDDPGMPTSGSPQPVLDTASRYDNPNINWGGHKEDPYLPTCATIPTGSTDVQNPESHGSDVTPKDIFKGGTGNG